MINRLNNELESLSVSPSFHFFTLAPPQCQCRTEIRLVNRVHEVQEL